MAVERKGVERKSYMGSRRWEDRKKCSGKERWMWRMCEGETEMGQREKHGEVKRQRESENEEEEQLSGFSLSVSGWHYCLPHPSSLYSGY